MTPQEIVSVNAALDLTANGNLLNPISIDAGKKLTFWPYTWAGKGNPEIPELEEPKPPAGGEGGTDAAPSVDEINTALMGSGQGIPELSAGIDAFIARASAVCSANIGVAGFAEAKARLDTLGGGNSWEFFKAQQTDSGKFFASAFPDGSNVSSGLLDQSKITSPSRSMITPAFLMQGISNACNQIMGELGRPPMGDPLVSLVEAASSAMENLNAGTRMAVFASTAFNGFGLYEGTGYDNLLEVYGSNLENYYVKPLNGRTINGHTKYPFKPQTPAQALSNINRTLDILVPLIGEPKQAWTKVINLQNVMIDMSMCMSIANSATQLLNSAPHVAKKMFNGVLLDKIKEAQDRFKDAI